jgi:hypothetical protein
MPILHGWNLDSSRPDSYSYGGSYFSAFIWQVGTGMDGWRALIWPRLLNGTEEVTKPLSSDTSGGIRFDSEQDARTFVESWEFAQERVKGTIDEKSL